MALFVLASACLGACTRDTGNQESSKSPANRLADVRRLIQRKDSAAALAALDRDFPGDNSPAVAEQRALAYDLAAQACSSVPCQFVAATNANVAQPTADRTSRASLLRREAMDLLAIDHVVDKPLGQRVKQLSELADTSSVILKSPQLDPILQDLAKRARTFADAERAKVPLIQMDAALAPDLLGPAKLNAHDVPMFDLGGATAYLAVGGDGKCVGIYAVGDESALRTYKSSSWPAERLLSQAFGRPATIKRPAAGSSTSRWYEATVPVVVRWRSGEIVELRIGDAAP